MTTIDDDPHRQLAACHTGPIHSSSTTSLYDRPASQSDYLLHRAIDPVDGFMPKPGTARSSGASLSIATSAGAARSNSSMRSTTPSRFPGVAVHWNFAAISGFSSLHSGVRGFVRLKKPDSFLLKVIGWFWLKAHAVGANSPPPAQQPSLRILPPPDPSPPLAKSSRWGGRDSTAEFPWPDQKTATHGLERTTRGFPYAVLVTFAPQLAPSTTFCKHRCALLPHRRVAVECLTPGIGRTHAGICTAL